MTRKIVVHEEAKFDVIDIAFSHHERIGGGGYPRGLSSTEISFWNRLVSIVDVYDAITSDRCYHKGISPTEARHVLKDLDGKVDVILDSGPTEVGLESTVVDLTGREPQAHRVGARSPCFVTAS